MLGNSSSPGSSGSHPVLCESITQSSGSSGQLSTLCALGRVSRRGRSQQEKRILRLGVLGAACSWVRGPEGSIVDCRSGSCGAWWESDRPGLHGRSKRRLSLLWWVYVITFLGFATGNLTRNLTVLISRFQSYKDSHN